MIFRLPGSTAVMAAFLVTIFGCREEPAGGQATVTDVAVAAVDLDDEIGRLLMTVDQWKARFPGPAKPYSFTVRRGDRLLVYCGLPHTSDTSDPYLVWMERRWEAFVKETSGRNRTALVEGRLREKCESRARAISHSGGEGGLLTFLANRDGVGVACPEPSWEDLFDVQKESFELSAICHAYRLRALLVSVRRGEKVGADGLPDGAGPLEKLGCEVSATRLDEVHREIFGEPLGDRVFDEDYLRRVTDPVGEGPTNKVLAADARVRDLAIVKEVRRRWMAGESLFIVYGVGHAQMQEPALEAVLP